jgi:AmiR/NasT family two-component response regulator
MVAPVEDSAPGDAQREVARLHEEIANLRRALETREQIGQAVGILMVTACCGPDDAFRLLVSESQHTNRKLVDIARDLVATYDTESRRAFGP